MQSSTNTPLIGISCSFRDEHNHPAHTVGHRNVTAVIAGAAGMPVLLPAVGSAIDAEILVHRLDGVLLTGGASNIEPHHYQAEPRPDGTLRDSGRDNLVLPLIRSALHHAVPIFAVCRGIQELNVALGGTLHQYLHEVPGREDHRRYRERPLGEALGFRHTLKLSPGGLFAELAGGEEVKVNSLHGQGIDRLADRLQVEAVAEDGTIEAVSVKDAASFAVGVQWHAEWRIDAFPLHRALFRAFGQAATACAERRQRAAGGGDAIRPAIAAE